MRLLSGIMFIILFHACEKDQVPQADVQANQDIVEVMNYVFLSGKGVEVDSTVKMVLRIEGVKFSGKGPINNFFGSLTDEIATGPIGSTMMAGPEKMMKMETVFMELIEGGMFTGIGEDTLRVMKNDKTVLKYLKVSIE